MTNAAHRPDIPVVDHIPASEVLAQWLSSVLTSVTHTGRRGVLYALVGTAVGVAVALTLPSQYTSGASFIAQGASASLLPSALQGLAASVGIGTAKDYSPQFYADLLTKIG